MQIAYRPLSIRHRELINKLFNSLCVITTVILPRSSLDSTEGPSSRMFRIIGLIMCLSVYLTQALNQRSASRKCFIFCIFGVQLKHSFGRFSASKSAADFWCWLITKFLDAIFTEFLFHSVIYIYILSRISKVFEFEITEKRITGSVNFDQFIFKEVKLSCYREVCYRLPW